MRNNLLLRIVLLCLNVKILVYSACVQNSLDIARTNVLNRHNFYRMQHHVPNLALDATLNSIAQNYSNYLAINNLFKHSGYNYGENIYMMTAGSINNITDMAISATDAWYNEISKYNFSDPGYSSSTGHFTQVVWKKSVYLGIGISTGACGSSTCGYVVANYNPPGNYLGQFQENVLSI